MILYHATTPKLMEKYQKSKRIIRPVRGFSTEAAAIEWARKVGRNIVLKIEADKPWKLPDHHNQYGTAWWNEGDIIEWEMLK
jgi:hypothetical protein